MRKIHDIREYSFIKNIVDKTTHDIVCNLAVDMDKNGLSKSSIRRRVEIIVDLINTNNVQTIDDALKLYEKYFSIGISISDKLTLRYGEYAAEQYREKLARRPKPKNRVSHFSTSYWTSKGYSEDEAISKISELQSTNASKRTPSSYKKSGKKLKWNKEYWLDLGYSYDEAISLAQSHYTSNNTINYYIDNYGKEGKRLFKDRQERRKISFEKNREHHKSAGYVSKASLRFFIPLYKKIRRLGISREDIYFGISGSREFFIRHDDIENRGRFFDFGIPKINVILEYNGSYWHPRTRDTWKNVFVSFDDAMLVEKEKEYLCEKRGYTLIKIWDDDNLAERESEILNLIKERLNERR